jgi:hypothetical protein
VEHADAIVPGSGENSTFSVEFLDRGRGAHSESV